jgi:hypothetical protein
MSHSLLKSTALASMLALVGIGTAIAESQIPQLTGVWKGRFTGGFLAGDISHSQDFVKPQSVAGREKQWIVTIDKQDGSGLMGTRTAKGSEKTEVLLGVIKQDGKSILLSDSDTLFEATLITATTMEVCAQETGNAIIATCELLEKQ